MRSGREIKEVTYQCNQCSSTQVIRHSLDRLSPRQRQVVLEYAAGKRIKVIAAELGLARPTVEAHRTVAYRRLQVENDVQLIALLYSAVSRSEIELLTKVTVICTEHKDLFAEGCQTCRAIHQLGVEWHALQTARGQLVEHLERLLKARAATIVHIA